MSAHSKVRRGSNSLGTEAFLHNGSVYIKAGTSFRTSSSERCDRTWRGNAGSPISKGVPVEECYANLNRTGNRLRVLACWGGKLVMVWALEVFSLITHTSYNSRQYRHTWQPGILMQPWRRVSKRNTPYVHCLSAWRWRTPWIEIE